MGAPFQGDVENQLHGPKPTKPKLVGLRALNKPDLQWKLGISSRYTRCRQAYTVARDGIPPATRLLPTTMPTRPSATLPQSRPQADWLAVALRLAIAVALGTGLPALAQTQVPGQNPNPGAAPLPSPTQATQTPARFAIKGYKVLGNTLLHPQRVETIAAAHTGAQSDFETIQQAVEALEKAYANAGFGSVKVEVPEQELESGIVTLQVVEGKLGEVSVEANAHFDQANVLRSLPALRSGETTNTDELNRNLVLANDGGSKNVNVTFKRNSVTGLSDAVVKIVSEDPERWLALLDNSGSAATGYYRSGLIYQHANLFNKDHALSVQLMSSPGYWSQVGIVGLGYRIPLYGVGGALDLSASYSTVDSGRVAQAGGGPDLAISGGGKTFGAKYTHYLDTTALWQHRASVGLERRAFGNSVTLTGLPGGSLVPDLATTPLTLGYVASYRMPERDFSANLSLVQNLPGAPNGSTADFNVAGGRAGATDSFKAFKYSLQYSERWASQWSLRTALSGQNTTAQLISPEQFGAGGSETVRGFNEREVAGDQGWRLGLEAWAPPIEAGQWRWVPLAFIDTAQLTRNQPAPGEIAEQMIGSAGLGLRGTWGRSLSLRMDWGSVTRGVTGITGSRVGDQRLHATLIWNFQ